MEALIIGGTLLGSFLGALVIQKTALELLLRILEAGGAGFDGFREPRSVFCEFLRRRITQPDYYQPIVPPQILLKLQADSSHARVPDAGTG